MNEDTAILPASRLAQIFLILAVFSLAGAASVDRMIGKRQLTFERLGQELRSLEELEDLMDRWQKAPDAERRQELSSRVTLVVRQILRQSPSPAFLDRLTRIETLLQWSQSLDGPTAATEELRRTTERAQTQHRLRGEIKAAVAQVAAMQSTKGEEVQLLERGGQLGVGLGVVSAFCALLIFWRSRHPRPVEPFGYPAPPPSQDPRTSR
jgi:hypothetical protein